MQCRQWHGKTRLKNGSPAVMSNGTLVHTYHVSRQTNEQLSFPAQPRWHTASRRLTGARRPTGYTYRALTDRPGLAGLAGLVVASPPTGVAGFS